MNIINLLIGKGETEQAITVLMAARPEIAPEISLLSGQLTLSKRMWLNHLQDKSDHDKTVARVNSALQDYAKDMPVKSDAPMPSPTQK